MTANATKMSARQYAMLGADPPGVRLELVDGEIIVSPSPTPRHANTILELATLLRTHVGDNELGLVVLDVDITVDVFNVRRPDLLYYSKEHAALATAEQLEGVPDLAVEIVSPASNKTDKADKFLQYAKAHIKYYWIVDPTEETFEAYALKRGRYALTARGQANDTVRAAPFPALDIPLERLWWRSVKGTRP